MTSATLEVSDLIISTLKADAAVMALVHGVWDKPPSDPWGTKLAYISLGPIDINTDDADCVEGEEMVVQVDIWTRSPGRVAVKKIYSAAKAALRADLSLTDNALSEVEVQSLLILDDPDGLTTHGVMRVRVAAEIPDE